MFNLIKVITTILLFTTSAISVSKLTEAKEYDVVVVGGTPAGVAAAIAAARADKTVIIIEQAPVLGGVLS